MWALVAGGAKHLGANLCLSLAEKGYSVAIHYNTSKQEALALSLQCKKIGVDSLCIQGDFSSVETTNDFCARYSAKELETTLFIYNVGNYLTKSALHTSTVEWTSLFQTNLHAPFILSSSLSASLIKNKGQILYIGTPGLNRHRANTYATAYTLTKQGLLSLTLSLAKELAPHKVRVNMVSPGVLTLSQDSPPIPMQRRATCGEVCRVALFLIDPASEYITGQNIEVAGGLGCA